VLAQRHSEEDMKRQHGCSGSQPWVNPDQPINAGALTAAPSIGATLARLNTRLQSMGLPPPVRGARAGESGLSTTHRAEPQINTKSMPIAGWFRAQFRLLPRHALPLRLPFHSGHAGGDGDALDAVAVV